MEEKILIKIKDLKSGAEQEITVRDMDTVGFLKNRILQCLAEVIAEKHKIEITK